MAVPFPSGLRRLCHGPARRAMRITRAIRRTFSVSRRPPRKPSTSALPHLPRIWQRTNEFCTQSVLQKSTSAAWIATRHTTAKILNSCSSKKSRSFVTAATRNRNPNSAMPFHHRVNEGLISVTTATIRTARSPPNKCGHRRRRMRCASPAHADCGSRHT